jgi:muramoyltetrapeptide carboxypeptidase
MFVPPKLIPGSKIRIVSPAGKCSGEEVFPAMEWLTAQGFRVETGKNYLATHFQYAGTDRERLADLQEALDDPEARAIICTRGGYGTIRLIDQLDFSRFRKFPKWVVGFSDITVLHNRLHLSGFHSVHGAMCRSFFDEKGNISEGAGAVLEILQGKKPEYHFPATQGNRQGTVKAILTGGNLSLLYSLTGTPYDVDWAGKILFLEDISEYLYHIDRMMVSLRLAGKLKYLAGLIAGQFTELKDNEDPFGSSVKAIILDAVRDYDFPVCFGFPAGHEHPNLALRMGSAYKLKITGKNCSLKLL